MGIPHKCVILRHADATDFPVKPACPKGLAFYQFALKAVHLTPHHRRGGNWIVRHEAVGVIALPAEHRGDKARCAVDGR